MDQHHKFHLFGAQNAFQLVICLVVVSLQVLNKGVGVDSGVAYNQVFVGSDEGLVTQLEL